MSKWIIVVQYRSGYVERYKGGRQNFKNWRYFVPQTKEYANVDDAWAEWRAKGGFNALPACLNKKPSASAYTSHKFAEFIIEDVIPYSEEPVRSLKQVCDELIDAASHNPNNSAHPNGFAMRSRTIARNAIKEMVYQAQGSDAEAIIAAREEGLL